LVYFVSTKLIIYAPLLCIHSNSFFLLKTEITRMTLHFSVDDSAFAAFCAGFVIINCRVQRLSPL
jgi:hypothetical protein